MTTEHQPGSPVTAEQAHESHQRLVDHFFGNPAERPRVSIPARLDRDDDLVVSRYIDQAEAELRTLRARVESYAMDLAALEGTNAANEGALRIQLERLHGERFRAESAEARIAELEKLFDDAGQGEYNVLALIDHYQSEAMAESEARRAALARVGELECAEADLEAQLAAAREDLGASELFARALIAKIDRDGGKAQLGESLQYSCHRAIGVVAEAFAELDRLHSGKRLSIEELNTLWQASGRNVERFADVLESHLRAILEVENKS
jgi:hypothetical protein